MRQIAFHSPSCVVGMSMGNNCLLYGLPGIDINSCLCTINTTIIKGYHHANLMMAEIAQVCPASYQGFSMPGSRQYCLHTMSTAIMAGSSKKASCHSLLQV